MTSNINRFFNELLNKTIVFVGIGVSHTETIKLFAKQGLKIIACDKRDRSQLDEDAIKAFEDLGVELQLGTYNLMALGADIIFRTPGMYFHQEDLAEFRQKGGIVTSEMEVFFKLCPCTTFAITGSDGKTTTTTLIAKMLKASGKTVHLGGNIGKALLPEIFNINTEDFVVVELSSFQLISMRPSPDISVITNITPNHLDVHSSMDEYVNSKRNVFIHQDAFSKTVLGADNEITSSFKPEVRGELLSFSNENPVYNGAYLMNGEVLTIVRNGVESPLFNKSEIKLPGIHNVANYLAAISATLDYVSNEDISSVAKSFSGVEHRIEFVRELNGVQWYNDSIATSPNRAIAGLRSFNQKVVLIAGGYDKKLPFTPLAPEIIQHVKLLILAGPTSLAIEQAVIEHENYQAGNPVIINAENIPEAVRLAFEHSTSGDIVTLSPASTSFDAYPNFEFRGKHFKELVNKL